MFSYRSAPGEFIGDWKWDSESGQPTTEIEFQAVAQAGDDWPWWSLVSGRDGLEQDLMALREDLAKMRKWG